MQSQVVELTAKLVRLPSISGQEREVAACLADFLDEPGLSTSIDSNGNVIARIGPEERRAALMLNGHMDTVPVGESHWDHDPYDAHVEDGAMTGRGTADMKGGLAAMAVAVKRLVPASKRWQRSVLLTAVVNEEAEPTDQREKGTVHVLRSGYVADFAIVGEASDLNVSEGHRTRIIVQFTGRGDIAHSSMPRKGTNAIEALTSFLQKYCAAVRTTFRSNGQTTSVAVVNIEGGIAANVIPDRCTATVDVRVPGYNGVSRIEVFTSSFVRRFNANRAAKIEFIIVGSRPGVDSKAPEAKRFARGLLEIVRPIVPTAALSWNRFNTDAGYIQSELGIPVAIFGPGNEQLAHKRNESVQVAQLDAAADAYEVACRHFVIAN